MCSSSAARRMAALTVVAFGGIALFSASSVDAALSSGGSAYEVVVDPNVTWSQAAAAASASGGRLVSINSAGEQAIVEQLLADDGVPAGQYWIGLRKSGSTYGWTSGEPLDHPHWFAGQPDNDGGNETVARVLWTPAGEGDAGADARRGFWNDLPDHFVSSGASLPDLNTGGYVIERSTPVAAVPLPAAAWVAPAGFALAWAGRRWVR